MKIGKSFLLLALTTYNATIYSKTLGCEGDVIGTITPDYMEWRYPITKSENVKTLQQDLQNQYTTGTSDLDNLNKKLFLLDRQHQCEKQGSQEICQKLLACKNSFSSFVEAYNNPFILADRHNARLKDQYYILEHRWIADEISHAEYLEKKDALKKEMQTVVITLLADKIAACKAFSQSQHLIP